MLIWVLPVDKMIITKTFTMVRWTPTCRFMVYVGCGITDSYCCCSSSRQAKRFRFGVLRMQKLRAPSSEHQDHRHRIILYVCDVGLWTVLPVFGPGMWVTKKALPALHTARTYAFLISASQFLQLLLCSPPPPQPLLPPPPPPGTPNPSSYSHPQTLPSPVIRQ